MKLSEIKARLPTYPLSAQADILDLVEAVREAEAENTALRAAVRAAVARVALAKRFPCPYCGREEVDALRTLHIKDDAGGERWCGCWLCNFDDALAMLSAALQT